MKTEARQDEVATIQFEAHLTMIGKWLIVKLPQAASERLPSRGQVAIRGTINGHMFKRVMEPDGRWGHWFKISKDLQKAIGVREGDVVAIGLTPTKEWPEPEVPKDFERAIADSPTSIQELWKKITPMARWEWVRWVNETRNPQTRARRVEVSISKMQSGKRRPCCFNLAACTDPDLSKSGRLIEPAIGD